MESSCNSIESFYEFEASMALASAAVEPVIFTNAVISGDHSWRREIHRLLAWGEYPEDLQFPVIFRHLESKDWRDLVDMRYTSDVFLISKRLESILRDNSITGWQSYPIKIYDKKDNEVDGYLGFSVVGRGGSFYGVGSPEWENRDWRDRKKWDKTQWDGSDLFRINPNYMIATPRVRNLLVSNKIRGAKFTPFSEFVDFI